MKHPDWPADRSAEIDVFLGEANRRLHRSVVAQDLLDRARHQIGSLAEQIHLRGIASESEHPVADEIGRRLVAGEQQEEHECEQFVGVHRFGIVVRGDESAYEVGARIFASPLDLIGEIVCAAHFFAVWNSSGSGVPGRVLSADTTVSDQCLNCW